KQQLCRPAEAYWPVASCSTAKRLVEITYDAAPNRPKGSPCYLLHAMIWTGSSNQPASLEGELDPAASVDGRLVLRLPAKQPGQDLVLTFERGAATLQVGGEREACVVSRLSPS